MKGKRVARVNDGACAGDGREAALRAVAASGGSRFNWSYRGNERWRGSAVGLEMLAADLGHFCSYVFSPWPLPVYLVDDWAAIALLVVTTASARLMTAGVGGA